MKQLAGSVPNTPVDIQNAIGAGLLIIGAIATVIWHRIRMVSLSLVGFFNLDQITVRYSVKELVEMCFYFVHLSCGISII